MILVVVFLVSFVLVVGGFLWWLHDLISWAVEHDLWDERP